MIGRGKGTDGMPWLCRIEITVTPSLGGVVTVGGAGVGDATPQVIVLSRHFMHQLENEALNRVEQ